MARRQRRDRISELPADILDMILGFLPIEEAARMAVLSTFWSDIWFSLTQLNFDARFFNHIKKKCSRAHSDISTQNIQEETKNSDSWTLRGLFVINNVLMQHNGLIRKFVLDFLYPSRNTLKDWSFDINQWLFLVTRKGVEEIHLSLMPEDEYISRLMPEDEYISRLMPKYEYRLPNCIFSCLTLRRLHLCGGSVKPINAHCTLPNVTSLCFENVNFGGRHLPVDVPMLNNLSFKECDKVSDFNITAQKLDSLAIDGCRFYQLPVNLDLRSVRTLDLDSSSLKDFVSGFTRRGLQLQPPARNVEYLMLSRNDEHMGGDISSAFIHLLQICPKLCKLDIDLLLNDDAPKLLKNLHTVAQRHKMLHTLKVNKYPGGEDETLFIKGLLACFPALEKVVINPEPICDRDEDFENNKEELLHFPCASTKAKIIFA